MIIGVAGRKRHGKDTVGQILVRRFGFNPMAFADPVKRIAADMYGLTHEQLYGSDTDKETILPEWGLSPRQFFQRLGTEVARQIHPETWTRYTMRKCVGDVVITDVRFPNEAEAVRTAGGRIWKVVRPSIVSTDGHASETSVDLIHADVVIVNDGSLADLEAKVVSLLT